MKKQFTILLTLLSISAMASMDQYTCQSRKGTIVLEDNDDKSVSVDLTNHEVILQENAITTLANSIEDVSTFYSDYVLRISPKTVRKEAGISFSNNFFRTVIESRNTESLSTCNFEMGLNKYTQKLKLSYDCSLLFKKMTKFADVLKCERVSVKE